MKVAVIGGGIVGATASFYLKKDHHHVTLYDEGTGQATKAAAGIISPWLSQRRNKNWYQLAQLGAKFYPKLVSDLALPNDSEIYRQVGTILFKKNDALLDKLFKLAENRKIDSPEIGEIRLLNPAEIKKLIPLLKTTSNALYVSGGAKVDGQALVNQLISDFTNAGGDFVKEQVTQITPIGDKWVVQTNSQQETFDKLILATGAWLPTLVEPLGFKVDVRGQKGQLVEVKIDAETSNWPVVMPQGESDIIPFDDGRVVIGASHENEQLYDLTSDPKILKDLLESIAPLSPDLSQQEINNYRVGTRAYTSDFLPFFGEVKELPGLFVASGLGSSGLTTGPIIAHTLAAWVNQEATILNPHDYAPDAYITKQ